MFFHRRNPTLFSTQYEEPNISWAMIWPNRSFSESDAMYACSLRSVPDTMGTMFCSDSISIIYLVKYTQDRFNFMQCMPDPTLTNIDFGLQRQNPWKPTILDTD